jgi:UDP-N-acetylglucosamine diphosphorylase/glucosamine-1-phosphate N-acetyltransferase
MNIVLFEDEQVTQLYPITIGRAAARITCGSFTLWELCQELGERPTCLVRPHLRETLTADDVAIAPTDGSKEYRSRPGAPLVLINARLVPNVAVVERVLAAARLGKPGAVTIDGVTALAILPANAPPLPVEAAAADVTNYLALQNLPPLTVDLLLIQYPHDVIRHHPAALAENLSWQLKHKKYNEIADGVFVAEGAKLGQYCVTETDRGPIVLEAGASIGPYCFLRGPAHVGRNARVIEQAAIKDGVSIGHTTKIGGEVEGSIIEAYTNKQHHGFMGHSYLGSWVNLGAGTCNSDLKNTYGTVNMEYAGRKVPTGMQFVGAIIGDYAKTAINTGIFTGKTIGACSMVYGFVTTNVPSFVNYARLFGQVTEAGVDVMTSTQARMFARRNVTQRPSDIRLLHDMYELTRHERQLAGEPLSL